MSTLTSAIPSTQVEQGEWKASANPWAIAVSVMIATFMVVLDSSVANVALPHIAGNLSASTDESTWVLTSYLVSNAIMLPAAGWTTRRIGRKRLFLASIVVFTGFSLLHQPSNVDPRRILQGFGGGGMQPWPSLFCWRAFPAACTVLRWRSTARELW